MSNEQDQAAIPAGEGAVPAVDQSAATDAAADTVSGDTGNGNADAVGADAADGESPAAEAPASVPAAVEPVPAPVAAVAKPVVTAPPRKTMADATVEEYVLYRNKHLSALSKTTLNIIERMKAYAEAMAKNNVMGDTNGGGHQRDLYFTILTALQGKEEDLAASMDAICWFFVKYRKDCLSEPYAFRFMNAVRLDRNESQCLQYLLRVFVSASDPAGRALALKQIDMNRASSKITDLQARDNFLKYFLG